MQELIGKCKTCLGCNRLELIEFKGTYRCENYIKGGNEYDFCNGNKRKGDW